MIHTYPFFRNNDEKYSISFGVFFQRISSLIKTSFRPSERKKQKSIGPVISHGMPESVISIRRNRSSVYNLAINDPITVTLRRGVAFLRSPPFLFFSCQKFFQLRIIIFPGMSRQFPTPLLPSFPPPPFILTLPPRRRVRVGEPSLPRQPSSSTPVQPLISEKFFSRFLPRVGTQPFPSFPSPVERGTGSLAQKNFNSSPTTEKVSDDFLFPRIFTTIRTSKDSLSCCLCRLKILGLAFVFFFVETTNLCV